uniref:Uncharacterized protein n=1 Tax=Rhizophora mucronata TaxID=61149 RepID=A0A2P2JMM4_RHIMU
MSADLLLLARVSAASPQR